VISSDILRSKEEQSEHGGTVTATNQNSNQDESVLWKADPTSFDVGGKM